ncbi:MAG: hypothetical protein AAGF15_02480 [Pseudomonadota bacterium]
MARVNNESSRARPLQEQDLLVIAENGFSRKLYLERLQQLGYSVSAVARAHEASKALSAKPYHAIIFVANCAQGGCKTETASIEKIRKKWADLPVLALFPRNLDDSAENGIDSVGRNSFYCAGSASPFHVLQTPATSSVLATTLLEMLS